MVEHSHGKGEVAGSIPADGSMNKNRIKEIEAMMQRPYFWENKEEAQALTRELHELKKHSDDKHRSILTIISGVGGDDAEDFANMLLNMYVKYITKQKWGHSIVEKKENEVGGIKRVVVEISHQGSYEKLRDETGVHRLVRVSPFNAKKQRHTSFALVEVIPKLPPVSDIELEKDDIEISIAKASGPGGQNVNKRETSVRVTHKGTGLNVHVESERSQLQNKERALELLRGKLFLLKKKERKEQEMEYKIGNIGIEWGQQVRSYVLHPYKMVKDNRSGYNTSKVEEVFDGNIEEFLNTNNEK